MFLKRTDMQIFLIALGVVCFLSLIPGCSKNQDGISQKTGSSGETSKDGSSAMGNYVLTHKNRILSEGPKSAKFVLETKNGNDVLNVVVLDKAKDSESIRYECEWTKNGETAGTGTSVSDFKRGDKMSVKITPVDGETLGRSKTLTTEIKNSTPKIVESKSISSDDKHVSYQIVAKDADGDPLTYSLVDGAKGMTIDSKSGILQWSNDPAAPQADITATVKVVDGQGGEVIYPLKVQQQEKPAK